MTTSDNLTLPGFEPTASNESPPSAAASPARTSASPARVPAWTVSDPACGESFAVSFATFDPATCSWRTSGLLAAEDSQPFSQTLPRSGMTQSGTLFQLPPLVRLTSVTASGSSGISTSWLPTPTARLGDDTGRTLPSKQTAQNRWAQGRRNLDDAVMLLPTPCAQMPAGDPRKIIDRRERVRQTGINGNGFGLNLAQWASIQSTQLLPTPQAEDHRNCADYSDRSRGHSPQLRHLWTGRLNPRFVEWMMGFPPDWTSPD